MASSTSVVPSVQSAVDRLMALQKAYGCIPGIGADMNRDVSLLLAGLEQMRKLLETGAFILSDHGPIYPECDWHADVREVLKP